MTNIKAGNMKNTAEKSARCTRAGSGAVFAGIGGGTTMLELPTFAIRSALH